MSGEIIDNFDIMNKIGKEVEYKREEIKIRQYMLNEVLKSRAFYFMVDMIGFECMNYEKDPEEDIDISDLYQDIHYCF